MRIVTHFSPVLERPGRGAPPDLDVGSNSLTATAGRPKRLWRNPLASVAHDAADRPDVCSDESRIPGISDDMRRYLGSNSPVLGFAIGAILDADGEGTGRTYQHHRDGLHDRRSMRTSDGRSLPVDDPSVSALAYAWLRTVRRALAARCGVVLGPQPVDSRSSCRGGSACAFTHRPRR